MRDSLEAMKLRLTVLVEENMDRAAALRAEADALEQELEEARALLERWDSLRKAPTTKPVLHRIEPTQRKLTKEHIVEVLTKAGRPMFEREILDACGVQDGRCAIAIRTLVSRGLLDNLPDGTFTLPLSVRTA